MTATDLVRLQDADDHVGALAAEISQLRALLHGEAELAAATAGLAEATSSSRAAGEALAAAEAEVARLDQRARSMDRKLYGGSVHNPNELLELQRELDGVRAELGRAEEAMLSSLEASDAAEQRQRHAQARLAAVEHSRGEQDAPRRERLSRLEADLASAEEQRRSIVEAIGGPDLALYRRVAARHHPAVVSIQSDQCGGCHLPLSNEERRAVRAGTGIVQCSNCDRILVP